MSGPKGDLGDKAIGAEEDPCSNRDAHPSLLRSLARALPGPKRRRSRRSAKPPRAAAPEAAGLAGGDGAAYALAWRGAASGPSQASLGACR